MNAQLHATHKREGRGAPTILALPGVSGAWQLLQWCNLQITKRAQTQRVLLAGVTGACRSWGMQACEAADGRS